MATLSRGEARDRQLRESYDAWLASTFDDVSESGSASPAAASSSLTSTGAPDTRSSNHNATASNADGSSARSDQEVNATGSPDEARNDNSVAGAGNSIGGCSGSRDNSSASASPDVTEGKQRSCCAKIESVLLWTFVVVFVVLAFYGALRHNFVRVLFSNHHPVNQFVRKYHNIVWRIAPFTKYGYVMFANRQPAEYTFSGFHVMNKTMGHRENDKFPFVEDQMYSLAALQPTTSLYYEDSRVWIDERKFFGNPHKEKGANLFYQTLCEQYFISDRIPNANANATIYVEHRTVLLPLEASTPENPTHYWPYVTYRQFRECTYNSSVNPRDAVVVTFRKDLTIPGPHPQVKPHPVDSWQAHYRPLETIPPATLLKYHVANAVMALCFFSIFSQLSAARRHSPQVPARLQADFRGAVMLQVFSKLLYTGAIVHFLPKLWEWEINFNQDHFFAAVGAGKQWDPWIKDSFLADKFPLWSLQILRWATIAFLTLGFVGVGTVKPELQIDEANQRRQTIPRVVALGSYFCLYVIASINAFQIQTLALLILWAVFPCMAVLHERPRMLRGILMFYFLFGTLCAGAEKVHSNWPSTNPMHSFLRIPALVREPFVPWMIDLLPESAPLLMSWASMLSEVLVPLMGFVGALTGFKFVSHVASIANLLFFTGIVFMMSVPALFWFAYGAGVSALLYL